MPKIKPHKGLKKRVRITSTGKVMRIKAGRRHLKASKSGKRVRQSRRKLEMSTRNVKSIAILLGKRL
ncbi:MAG: 50S ribosomal protein L35 [Planctomycetes bacterium]|nr:50S ribosomal protein L35 [Planctomycetota bacterium]